MEEYKIISKKIYNPAGSIFKGLANDRATCTTIRCSLDKCPLRDKGACILAKIAFLGSYNCPYGKISTETGYTKRARAYYSWIGDRQKKYEDIPSLQSPSDKMEFIGEYIYLPYSHMGSNDNLPLVSASGFMGSHSAFILKSDWSLKVVLALLDYRPQALFGGEITSYQRETIPLFLTHLREIDQKMWNALIKERPALDVKPNYVGRKALLHTLNSPIEWETNHETNKVKWKWDGEFLYTTSPYAYDHTWGKMALKAFELKATPHEAAELKVQDNAWVNKNTKFVD